MLEFSHKPVMLEECMEGLSLKNGGLWYDGTVGGGGHSYEILQDEKKEFAYAELALYTSVEVKDLKVVSVYTTKNPASSSKGAMTLTCQAPDGTMIDVRTVVLNDENGNLVTASYFMGKTIDVKGIVDYYKYSSDDEDAENNENFPYQIKLLSLGDVTVK